MNSILIKIIIPLLTIFGALFVYFVKTKHKKNEELKEIQQKILSHIHILNGDFLQQGINKISDEDINKIWHFKIIIDQNYVRVRLKLWKN